MVTVNILWALTSECNVPAARSIHQALTLFLSALTYILNE